MSSKPLRFFLARFVLRNGHRGQIPVVAPDTCHAHLQLLDHFGDRLRSSSVRPA